jgi:hypothetical protein
VSYLPPQIVSNLASSNPDDDSSSSTASSAVSGPGLFGASTRGGQKLVILGTNFGPVSSFNSPLSFYGDFAEEYDAANCQVDVAHTQIS